jgi:hypothetical protein
MDAFLKKLNNINNRKALDLIILRDIYRQGRAVPSPADKYYGSSPKRVGKNEPKSL